MGSFEKATKSIAKGKKAAPINAANLPIGYEVKQEAINTRATFALRASVLEALTDIAKEEQKKRGGRFTRNALINEILEDYVNKYYKR